MQQYSLSLERQLGSDWVASISYLGNKATHFRTGYELNPAIYTGPGATTKNTQARRSLTQLKPTWGPTMAPLL